MLAIWIIMAFYIILMIAIGIFSAKKANSLTAFVVGGRKAGAWMSAFSYGTTYFSAVLFIGYAGRSGWDFGLWAVLIGLGNAFLGTFLAWKVLAEPTREATRRLKIKSMPQLFKKRYNSQGLKILSAIVIFIFMIPYSASVYQGLSYLCTSVFKIDYHVVMAIIAIIAAIYLVLGGYLATLIADFFQGIIMLVGMILMIIFIVKTPDVGGISGISENIMLLSGMKNESTAMNIFSLLGLILLTSIGSWGMPQMVHKFYGISDKKAIKSGTVISTLFAFVIAGGSYFVGSLAKLFMSEVPKLNGKEIYDMIIPEILTKALPDILLGIILVLVLSASISTLTGLTLSSCSSVSMDLIKEKIKPEMSKKRMLLLTRILCILFIIFSYVIAVFKTPILMLMSFSWGTIAGAFLAPYMLGLFWKKMNKIGALCSMITGISVNVILAVGSKFNSGLAPLFGTISVVLSFAAAVIGSTIANKRGIDFSEEEKFYTDDLTKEEIKQEAVV